MKTLIVSRYTYLLPFVLLVSQLPLTFNLSSFLTVIGVTKWGTLTMINLGDSHRLITN